MALRSNLTPFLKAVIRALSLDLEVNGASGDQRKAVFDEILQNLPAGNSTSNFCTNFSQASDTLNLEFDGLKGMNIK